MAWSLVRILSGSIQILVECERSVARDTVGKADRKQMVMDIVYQDFLLYVMRTH